MRRNLEDAGAFIPTGNKRKFDAAAGILSATPTKLAMQRAATRLEDFDTIKQRIESGRSGFVVYGQHAMRDIKRIFNTYPAQVCYERFARAPVDRFYEERRARRARLTREPELMPQDIRKAGNWRQHVEAEEDEQSYHRLVIIVNDVPRLASRDIHILASISRKHTPDKRDQQGLVCSSAAYEESTGV